MPYRRSGMRRARRSSGITQSVKLQRKETSTYVGGNANVVYQINIGKELADVTSNQIDNPVGSKVFGFDISVNFISSTGGQTGTFEWFVWKARTSQSTAGVFADPKGADWSELGLSAGRNQIIKSFMGIYGTEDASAVRYNMHIKVPKLMQRTRLNDVITLVFNASDAGTLSIGSRYKYYT